MFCGCMVRYTPLSTWNAAASGARSARNSATSISRITGPPKESGAPVVSCVRGVGRLRITPSVLPSADWLASTTVSRKFGSVRPGFATSSTPFGGSCCVCAPTQPATASANRKIQRLS